MAAGERHMEASLIVLDAATGGFCRYIEDLPAEALVEKAWGPKEVLAHLVHWQDAWVTQAETILARQPYTLPRGRFEDVNAEVVHASRGVPVDELLGRFRAVHERTRQVAREPRAERLQLRLKAGAALQSLEWFIVAEAGHIHDHQRTLELQAARDARVEEEALQQAVEALCGLVAALRAGPIQEQARAELAHLVLCCELLVAQVAAVQAGQPFVLPQGPALQAQAEALATHATVDELLVRLWAAAQQLGRDNRALDPQQVVLEVWRLQMSRGSTYRTLDDAVRWLEMEVRKRHREWGRQWMR